MIPPNNVPITDITDPYYDELSRKLLKQFEGANFDYSKQSQLDSFFVQRKREIPKRNWSAYNQAQCQEKVLFLKFIHDVVETIREPEPPVINGRPPKDKFDIIKALAIKVFSGASSRRVMSDIEFARSLGYIKQKIHFNSLNNWLRSEEITFYLHQVYTLLAMPLYEVEEFFAVDASGFSAPNKKRWIEVRLDKGEHKDYKKLHLICGVKTNIVTRAIVTHGTSADTKEYEELLWETAKIFNVKEVTADSGYLSKRNTEAAKLIGAQAFIKPKKNTRLRGYGAWGEMLRIWKVNKPYFMYRYSLRSNVETVFSMIKKKYGSFVRSKNTVAQENEILLKVACHNASILIRSMIDLGVSPSFSTNFQKLHKNPKF